MYQLLWDREAACMIEVFSEIILNSSIFTRISGLVANTKPKQTTIIMNRDNLSSNI